MKFTTSITLFTIISGAFALVVERDLATVKKVIADVQTGVDNLDAAAKAFNGDVKPVTDSANKLIGTIEAGTTTVTGTSKLTLSEALALVRSVQDLKKHSQTLVDDLKARKGDVEKAKQCDVTKTLIAKINTDSQALIKVIVSKVPESAQNIAAEQAKGITDVLTDAQNSFATCKNA